MYLIENKKRTMSIFLVKFLLNSTNLTQLQNDNSNNFKCTANLFIF